MYRIVRQESKKIYQVFTQPAFAYLAMIGNTILMIAVFIVYHLEKTVNPKMSHFLDALWWGVSTITTVGYGDVVPVTVIGRLIGLALMYTGTVLFISFTGMLVTVWMKTEVERELRPIEKEVRKEEVEQSRIEVVLEEINERLKRLEKK